MGYHAQALRQYAIAVGEQAMATGNNAVAMGHGARALTQGSIVIGGEGNGSAGVQQGNLNTALDALDTIEHGGYSMAIGTLARTTAKNAIAIGSGPSFTVPMNSSNGPGITHYYNDSMLLENVNYVFYKV